MRRIEWTLFEKISTIHEDNPSTSEVKDAAVSAYAGDMCPYSEMSYLDAPTDTYFVYDDRGRLCYVLPPEASARLEKNPKESGDIIASLCYVYEYDDLGRCVSKKLPGREPVLMRYDKGGRLCLEQDGNLREKAEWRITLRDRYGRTAVTALAKVAASAEACGSVLFRADYTGDGALCGYAACEAVSKIISDCEIENIYFYDSYGWLGNFATDSLSYQSESGYDSRYRCKGAPERSAVGLCTGKVTRVYGEGDTLACAIYYDELGNVVQRHERNHMGGYEHFYYRLTFTGKPLEIKRVHSTADTIISDIVRYTCDNMERQLTISLDHNGTGETLLSGNAYDRLGRLSACSINGGCNVAYAYNVRGWTRNINASVGTATIFGQTLHYEDAPSGGTPCWSGNISGISWRQRESLKAATPTESQYLFRYDALNRLTRADYSSTDEQWNGDLLTQGDRNFSCAYAYDLNGNMLSLKRHGVNFYNTAMPTHIRSFGLIDDLAMTYSGNQLKSVTDQAEELAYTGAMDFKDGADKADEYAYDANGNMTRDLNKGISRITYNPLNLPERILFADGHETRYTYAADGRKLRAEYLLSDIAIIDADKAASGEASTFALNEAVTAPGIGELPAEPAVTTLMVRDYCGDHIYLNGKIERTLTPSGYIQDGEPYFYIKDYQGNVRAVLNQQNQVVELTAYYPYGAPMAATAAESVQPYKYGAKELDRENGLNWCDSHARFYAPLIGRTPTQDPMAEKYPHLSPYLWCAANPVNFTDPSGKDIVFAEGSSPQFKRDYELSVTLLKEKGVGGFITKLENNHDVILYIKEGDESKFVGSEMTLYWNSMQGAKTNENVNLSPATILNHEFDHATNYVDNPSQHIIDSNTKDCQYDNKEEKRVITGSEQKTAVALGELVGPKSTRFDHYATGFTTIGPTSTIEDLDHPIGMVLDEVVVTVKH